MQQEYNQLIIELHKYKTDVEQMPQTPHKNYSRLIRKRKHYRDLELEEESDESHSYVTQIRRRSRRQGKRIIYEDEIDGVPDYEPQSLSEEEHEENNEIQIKLKESRKK